MLLRFWKSSPITQINHLDGEFSTIKIIDFYNNYLWFQTISCTQTHRLLSSSRCLIHELNVIMIFQNLLKIKFILWLKHIWVTSVEETFCKGKYSSKSFSSIGGNFHWFCFWGSSLKDTVTITKLKMFFSKIFFFFHFP